MTFLDTNIFLRFLLSDNKLQFQKVKKLFEKGAAGRIELATSVVVMFEIYWVLSSFYSKNRKEIAGFLVDLLSLAFIDFENREVLYEAVKLYQASSFDLEDSYNIAYARFVKASSFFTFDAKLEKFVGKRLPEK